MKRFILALCLMLAPSVVSAQEPTGYKVYLPLVRICNPRSQDLVLQLTDLPGGYGLGSSGPLVLSNEIYALGAIEGYENLFESSDPFSSVLILDNSVITFDSAAGARGYIKRFENRCPSFAGFTRFMSVDLGDSSAACEAKLQSGYYSATFYYIVFSRESTISGIATGALPFAASFDSSVAFAQKSLTKIDSFCRY